MAKRNKQGKSEERLFRVRIGHVLLGTGTAALVLALAVWSLWSMQVHSNDKLTIFAQESDSAALTFVQRESFSVMLKLEQWSNVEATARDVQISRAMLAQRLGVETQSGLKTFEVTSADYRAALATLDPIIRSLTNVDLAERREFRQSVDKVVQTFSMQTRELSETFQEVTRASVEATANERANAEFIQAMILFAVLIGSISLTTWIAWDIVRGFRRATAQIQLRQAKVDDSLGRLLLVQSMDERSRDLIQKVHDGLKTQDVVRELHKIVNDLLPGNQLQLELAGFEVEKFEMINPPELKISDRDFEFLRDRILEVLSTSLVHDQQNQDITYALEHDSLTGLANRNAFTSMVEAKSRHVNQNGGVAAIFYVDIDRFGDLNSSLGYQTGDLVLMNMGFRLSDELVGNEFAARLSSDEFAVVGVYKNESAARSRALVLLNHLNYEMQLNEVSATITVSMGCAISAVGHSNANELPRYAALAMHLAKKKDQRSSFVTYNADDHSHLMTTWQEEIAVRNALATGEFKVYFQPIVKLETRVPVGFEALIRWQRPGVGLVAPDNFLPLVNSAGLTSAVGADVIVQSLRAWQTVLQPAFAELGIDNPYISINLEAVQLQDEAFTQFLIGEAEHANVPLEHIQLEITEHALVGGDKNMEVLNNLRAKGIKIALDDFGTGYSNLGQTLQLPLDVLKLDRSLLHGIEDEDKPFRMVDDITRMAQGQELVVTAEGIESERVADVLTKLGLDRGQGYLFGKAMPASEIKDWAARHGSGRAN